MPETTKDGPSRGFWVSVDGNDIPHFSVRGDGLPSFLLSLSLWLSRNKDVVSEKLGKREPLDVTATPAVIRRTSVVSNGNVSLRREKQETKTKNDRFHPEVWMETRSFRFGSGETLLESGRNGEEKRNEVVT